MSAPINAPGPPPKAAPISAPPAKPASAFALVSAAAAPRTMELHVLHCQVWPLCQICDALRRWPCPAYQGQHGFQHSNSPTPKSRFSGSREMLGGVTMGQFSHKQPPMGKLLGVPQRLFNTKKINGSIKHPSESSASFPHSTSFGWTPLKIEARAGHAGSLRVVAPKQKPKAFCHAPRRHARPATLIPFR